MVCMDITDEDKKYMTVAIRLSEQSITDGGGPFGAIVVKDGKVIGRGTNCVTTSNDPTAHAEIVAIREACKILNSFQLEGCTLYTSTEPCPMCFGAIYWARLDKVCFANTREDAAHIHFDDTLIYNEIAVPHNKKKIPFVQLMREEAQVAFSVWNEKGDKVKY